MGFTAQERRRPQGADVSETIVYIDQSDIQHGKLDDLRAATTQLVEFIDKHNPNIIDYRFFIDADGRRLTLVAAHPDSAALEFHMNVGKEEFQKLAPMISLRSIDVFGGPSDRVVEQLRDKADALGEDCTVCVHEHVAGFARNR